MQGAERLFAHETGHLLGEIDHPDWLNNIMASDSETVDRRNVDEIIQNVPTLSAWIRSAILQFLNVHNLLGFPQGSEFRKTFAWF